MSGSVSFDNDFIAEFRVCTLWSHQKCKHQELGKNTTANSNNFKPTMSKIVNAIHFFRILAKINFAYNGPNTKNLINF